MDGLTASGTLYTLGVVRKICQGEDDEDDGSGGVRVAVFAPEGGELDSMLSNESSGAQQLHALN